MIVTEQDQDRFGNPSPASQATGEGFSGSPAPDAPTSGGDEGDFEVDEIKLQMVRERLRGEQSLGAGVGAGLVAAFVGAVAWAVVTVLTGYQIGWMAIGVGFLVGIAVRHFGKGLDTTFSIAGAALALLGCVLGNFLAMYGFVSQEMEIPLMEVFGQVDLATAIDLMVATFSPIDLLFYGFAVYEGWSLSTRQVTMDEMKRLLGEAG